MSDTTVQTVLREFDGMSRDDVERMALRYRALYLAAKRVIAGYERIEEELPVRDMDERISALAQLEKEAGCGG